MKAVILRQIYVESGKHSIRKKRSIHHDAHERHEEWRVELETRPKFNRLLFSFVLFVTCVVT